MNGIRFYEEFSNKRRGVSAGNCVAVLAANGARISRGEVMFDAVAAVFSSPNSGVAGTSVSAGYLRSKCKRVSEVRAREVHPNLHVYLAA